VTDSQLTRREKSFVKVDNMPEPLRQCVYDYGLPIVSAFMNQGITKPSSIHEIVREVWNGTRSLYQKKIGYNNIGSEIENKLDWLLIQNGANITARQLIRILYQNQWVILPACPSRAMLDASMSVITGHTVVCTKEQKHKSRLTAAIMAAAKETWPFLYSRKS